MTAVSGYMDAFVSKKRSCPRDDDLHQTTFQDEDSTETKLAILASMNPGLDTEALLEALLSCEGSVDDAQASLVKQNAFSPRKKSKLSSVPGYQSSLSTYTTTSNNPETQQHPPKKLTRKGKTLSLYSPEDVAAHTPCSIIHNFLPAHTADALLEELLAETPTFSREHFQLFEREVTSPHTFAFYVNSEADARRQKTEYVYNGTYMSDIRPSLPVMRTVGAIVKTAVNAEIRKRIAAHYPGGRKLQFQSPQEWDPNTSFVNCYANGAESVGYHSDQLTYLGPRAVIGSISLGVAREFRVRRVVPRDTGFDPADAAARKADIARADAEGQIAIHLPHNSLLVMHAEMQEEWKHSVAPAAAVEPHPRAGTARINITYRWYRAAFSPRFTPKCRCGVPTVLRCVQRQAATRGRYMWMCHVGYTPGKTGCGFFEWAVFDDDGEPPWSEKAALESV